jgi:Hint domain
VLGWRAFCVTERAFDGTFLKKSDPKRGKGWAGQSDPYMRGDSFGIGQSRRICAQSLGECGQAMTQNIDIMRHICPPSPIGQVQRGVVPFGARPAQNWLALSHLGLVDAWANPFEMMSKGCFVAEFHLPLPSGKVLINIGADQTGGVGFSVFVTPEGGISLLHRSGSSLLRFGVPIGLIAPKTVLRLTYCFDANTRQWSLRLDLLQSENHSCEFSGVGALSFSYSDIETICKQAECDPNVLWFGFSHQDNLPKTASWVGLRTPIETSRGTIAAGNLKVGDLILTQDRGLCPVRATHRVHVPARGSFAPILLRGPIYDSRCDIVVPADQRLMIAGSAVEYLFGTEAVLVAAKDVVDGHTALADCRQDVIEAVMLDLGGMALVGSENGLVMALGDVAQTSIAPLPCLTAFETVALMRMLGRVVSKVA